MIGLAIETIAIEIRARLLDDEHSLSKRQGIVKIVPPEAWPVAA